MATDLEWALYHWKMESKQSAYRRYRHYYIGNHPLALATERFRDVFGDIFRDFAENMCEPVVDALSDRLQVKSFKSNTAKMVIENVDSNVPTAQPRVAGAPPTPNVQGRKKVTQEDEVGEAALEIWRRNRMDGKSQEVHVEALSLGDAYVIVWPNDDLEAEIFPQLATECCVQYDPNNQKRIVRAAKMWWDDLEEKWYLNVYTPDGIVKYEQKSKTRSIPTTPDGWKQYDLIQNPYGIVPVFHFPNKAIKKLGYSELKNVIPLQDAQNKSVIDLLVAMEFASFKQRYIIGLEVEIDEETGQPKDPNAKNYGVNRLLSFADPDTKVGQFDATDLSQFLRVQEKFWASASRVSGTPLHYFYITEGDFPSGEAMKSAEARFIKKITDRQTSFGNVWEDVMLFSLMIDGKGDEEARLEVQWKDASPRSDSEIADTAVKKKAVGVSRSQILKELGYDDDTIMRMLEESDADTERQAMMKAPPEAGTNPNGQPQPNRPGTQGVRRQ